MTASYDDRQVRRTPWAGSKFPTMYGFRVPSLLATAAVVLALPLALFLPRQRTSSD